MGIGWPEVSHISILNPILLPIKRGCVRPALASTLSAPTRAIHF